MSALARYPVPQAVASGKVAGPRLYFRLEPTVVPDPVLEFLQPLQATAQGIPAGKVEDPRLHFSLEPIVVVTTPEGRQRIRGFTRNVGRLMNP